MMKLIQLFQKNSKRHDAEPLETYKVASGDTLWKLSQQHNVDVEDFLKVNPSITNPNMIYIGQVINIPDRKYPKTPVVQETNKKTYTVATGDNLWLLSEKLSVPYLELLEANKQISNPNFIYVGQVINIPITDMS